MSTTPNDPFAKKDPGDSDHTNPYAPLGGADAPIPPAAPAGGAPSYGTPGGTPPSPYGATPSPYGAPAQPYPGAGQQSYPPPGQQPYPGSGPGQMPAPYSAYTPAPSTNGMAVASMVTSLVGLLFCGGVLGPVGLILGIISLGQVKRTGQNGRGFALTGIIAGALSIVILFLLIGLGVFSAILDDSTY